MAPLLTIAIPTYNRLPYLRELLPDLIRQCKPYPHIEILVIDNHSDDGTFNYAAETGYPRICRNPVNVGPDENFVRCIEEARGDYVWLLGDDELLPDGAIGRVVKILHDHPATLIISGLPGSTEKSYWSYKSFIEDNLVHIMIEHAHIPRNIFKRAIFNCQKARQFQDTYMGHMYGMIPALMNAGTIYRTNQPIVSVRKNRAPLHTPISFLTLHFLQYLKYIGVPWYRRMWFLVGYTFWGAVQRNAGKCRDILKDTSNQFLKDYNEKQWGFR